MFAIIFRQSIRLLDTSSAWPESSSANSVTLFMWLSLCALPMVSLYSATGLFNFSFIISLCRYVEKVIEIEDFLQYKLRVSHNNNSYSYSDLCG